MRGQLKELGLIHNPKSRLYGQGALTLLATQIGAKWRTYNRLFTPVSNSANFYIFHDYG